MQQNQRAGLIPAFFMCKKDDEDKFVKTLYYKVFPKHTIEPSNTLKQHIC